MVLVVLGIGWVRVYLRSVLLGYGRGRCGSRCINLDVSNRMSLYVVAVEPMSSCREEY
jgi:hypothetical protein